MGGSALAIRFATMLACITVLGDPCAAVAVEREVISNARRLGRRALEFCSIGNVGEDSLRTGDLELALGESSLPVSTARRRGRDRAGRGDGDDRPHARRGDGDAIDLVFVEEPAIEDHDTGSIRHDMRGWIAFAEGRFKEASEAWLVMASMSALNAPYVLPRAAQAAIMAGDRAGATQALERLDATGAHGRALEVDRTAIRAGLAALDGGTAEAVAGYRAALAGWRELGLPWDEAITSLAFVRLVGTQDPEARAAVRSARVILERLRAVRIVAMLDDAIGDSGEVREASLAAGGTDGTVDAGSESSATASRPGEPAGPSA